MSGVLEVTVGGGTAPYNYTAGAPLTNVSVVGGSGTITGGTNSDTVQGANGTNLTFIGGSGAATVFGSTNSTMFGGTGNSNSLLVGGSGSTAEFAKGSGPTTLVAGTGNSTLNGASGSGSEAIYTNPFGSVSTLVNLNNNADTVVGGSGTSSVFSGTGSDVFGFVNGHAGGAENIYNFNASSTLVFGGYTGDPIASELVVGGSDVITLSDNTVITLEGIDHKVFNGIGTSN